MRASRCSLLLAAVLAALPSAAAAGKPRRSRVQAPPAALAPQAAPVAPPPAAPVASSPPIALPAPDQPTAGLLAEARRLFSEMEYEKVVVYARALTARPDADAEMRLDGYLLEGSSLAIIGDPIEAEKPFRHLLRGRPEFDLPPETPPRILAVFRKVQFEERSIARELAEIERRRLVGSLHIEGEVPAAVPGGFALNFDYQVRDPRGAVGALKLEYRHAGEGAFSSLALSQDAAGRWVGQLPGELTESEQGFVLEYYLQVFDARGESLTAIGAATAPFSVQVEPGSVSDSVPLYRSSWFWISTAAAFLAAGSGGYILYERATRLPEGDLGNISVR